MTLPPSAAATSPAAFSRALCGRFLRSRKRLVSRRYATPCISFPGPAPRSWWRSACRPPAGVPHDEIVVVRRMVGRDQHAVLAGQKLRRQRRTVHAGCRKCRVRGRRGMCGSLYETTAPPFCNSSISTKAGLSRASSTSFLYATPSTQTLLPAQRLAALVQAPRPAGRTTYCGMPVLISPANSMNRVVMPWQRASQVR